MIRLTAVERAFELAKSGTVSNTQDIREILKREGYSAEHLVGNSIRRQLKALIEAASASKNVMP